MFTGLQLLKIQPETLKMSLNTTNASHCDQFCAINVAAHVLIFAVVSLPGFLLNAVCIGALLLAKDIDWKIRVIMINVLAPELLDVFFVSFGAFGYQLRFIGLVDIDLSCALIIGSALVGFLENVLNLPFFAISAFVFLRYNKKKLNWFGIGAYIGLSWLVHILLGCLWVLDNLDSAYSQYRGFCIYERSFIKDPIPFVLLVYTSACLVVSVGVSVVVNTLSYCYAKKHAISLDPESRSEVERALDKIVLYEIASAIMSVIQVILATLPMSLFSTSLTAFLIYVYVRKVVIFSFRFVTPIVFIVLLKPIRDALRQKCKVAKNRE